MKYLFGPKESRTLCPCGSPLRMLFPDIGETDEEWEAAQAFPTFRICFKCGRTWQTLNGVRAEVFPEEPEGPHDRVAGGDAP